jgi:hypothetical protein
MKTKYLPVENITFKTKLTEKEIITRLSDIIQPKKAFRFSMFSSGSSKSYEGEVNGQTFEIKKIIGYRNSFLPRIHGIIERDFDGLRIKVKMRLHILVIVFLCYWCGGVAIACIAFLFQSFSNSKFNPAAFIPLGMLLFVYVLVMAGFKSESRKSKQYFQSLFEAELIEE